MRGIVVLFVLLFALGTSSHAFVASAPEPVVSQEGISGGPRIVLGSDPKTGRRHVQLVGQGVSVYPTIDITCDGTHWTFPATESRTVATYAVPQDTAETMLKAVECRLLIPGREIALTGQQLWAAWSSPSKGAGALERIASTHSTGMEEP